MKITIACVGKLKEKYLREGVEEYLKRLTPFAKTEIREISEEKMPDAPSDATRLKVLERETERLLKIIPEDSCVFLLDLQGEPLSSTELAKKISALTLTGENHFCFVIGGAFGFAENLRCRADFCWCLSRLTFTHQMVRLILVEQIYRAFKINRGEKYHW